MSGDSSSNAWLRGRDRANTQPPPTLLEHIDDQPVQQQIIFDPAVAHYGDGYRFGGPLGSEAAQAPSTWHRVQIEKLATTLQAVAESSIGRSLVLRGSWLLRSWFGERAREPHDLDFVHIGDRSPDGFLEDALSTLSASERCRAVGLRVDDLATSDIWTYERAVGRRIVIPWSSADMNGTVQLDVTFGEEIPGAPIRLTDPSTGIATVSAEVSLAWKLLWLHTDNYAQGKDLFDAVLLAENSHIGRDVEGWLRRAINGARPAFTGDLAKIHVAATEWAWFASEYPELATGRSVGDLLGSLATAID